MIRRVILAAAAMAAAALVAPPGAAAHGLAARADLPIPTWLFVWGAAAVIVVSFVALGALWREPRLEGDERFRPLPEMVGRVLTSRAVELLCGAVGVSLLVLVVWTGLAGVQSPQENFAPTFVYVIFWLGLVPLSLLFGDVFRAFNPWRAMGRVLERVVARGAGEAIAYPDRLGRWPAAAGILAFVWLEVIATSGDQPRTIALAAMVYTAVTLVGMTLFGAETWTRRAEAFSVYFGLLARMAPLERRGRTLGLRPPLAGLSRLQADPGTIGVLVVLIGTVSFDGGSGGPAWNALLPSLTDAFGVLTPNPALALQGAYVLGLIAVLAGVGGFYLLGARGASGGGLRTMDVARAFVHSLVPIAFAYAAAHYVSLLILQSQVIAPLASDPLGEGWNLLGPATWSVDYTLVGAETFWYIQVALVIAGHVAALTLAHDRALVLFGNVRQAVRSQYWMLAVMIGYTTFALWLLSQANEG
ncbi:MAG TPA: fenitrothion hydrolase [Solirubrobacteraceae bacterium]|nr:fenitrothion hydrolase [Solirubrobacteraceae bacterium]